jgi:hypothetical protein
MHSPRWRHRQLPHCAGASASHGSSASPALRSAEPPHQAKPSPCRPRRTELRGTHQRPRHALREAWPAPLAVAVEAQGGRHRCSRGCYTGPASSNPPGAYPTLINNIRPPFPTCETSSSAKQANIFRWTFAIQRTETKPLDHVQAADRPRDLGYCCSRIDR